MKQSTLRAQAYQILNNDSRPIAHGIVKGVLFIAIFGAISAAMIETLPSLGKSGQSIITFVRVLAMVVLSLELVVRFWVAAEHSAHQFDTAFSKTSGRRHWSASRLTYLFSPLGLVDLISVLPAWASLFTNVALPWFEVAAAISLFKLSRYAPALSLVAAVVVRQGRSIFAALIVLGIMLVVSATVVYIFENEAQPTLFESIPQSLWWAISTMATVGYGDMYPVTPIGRLIGGIAMVFGIAMFAVPAGILASGFAEELRKRDFVVNWQSVARVPLFARLDASVIASVAQLLKPRSTSANQAIVRRGDIADSMFFITEGVVEVELTPNPIRLKQGDFFGEIALIENVPRTATVVSLTDCRLLVLEASDFNRLTQQLPELKDQIKRTAHQRRSEN